MRIRNAKVTALKTVYLQFPFNFHPAYLSLVDHPPLGYRYMVNHPYRKGMSNIMSRGKYVYQFKYAMNQLVPIPYARSILTRLESRPDSACLTHSVWLLNLRNEPWILETGSLTEFGWMPWQMSLLRAQYLKSLESPMCKFVLTWYEILRKDLTKFFGSRRVASKVLTLPRAIEPKSDFCKYADPGKIVILFVGSGNQKGEFLIKGGPEVLAMFEGLCTEFENIELWIRSDMPSHYKERCARNPRVKVIEQFLTRDQLYSLYINSHILVHPSHHEEWAAILEAMSFGLPTVACDVYGQNENIRDGVDGFLVGDLPPVYDGAMMKLLDHLNEFNNGMMHPNKEVVRKLIVVVSKLVIDSNLRRKLGEAAKEKTMTANSIHTQRTFIKRIYDAAID